jgi:hypothetical protein
VKAKKENAIAEREAKIEEANQLANQASDLQAELRQVGTVVK